MGDGVAGTASRRDARVLPFRVFPTVERRTLSANYLTSKAETLSRPLALLLWVEIRMYFDNCDEQAKRLDCHRHRNGSVGTQPQAGARPGFDKAANKFALAVLKG